MCFWLSLFYYQYNTSVSITQGFSFSSYSSFNIPVTIYPDLFIKLATLIQCYTKPTTINPPQTNQSPHREGARGI